MMAEVKNPIRVKDKVEEISQKEEQKGKDEKQERKERINDQCRIYSIRVLEFQKERTKRTEGRKLSMK